MLRPHELNHADYVARSFDQIRRNITTMPDLCVALLRTLSTLAQELEDLGLDDRVEPLRHQARLVVAGAITAEPLPEDLAVVEQAAASLLAPRR